MNYKVIAKVESNDGLVIITPCRLFPSKKEKIKELIDKGDIESLLKAKKLLVEVINEK